MGKTGAKYLLTCLKFMNVKIVIIKVSFDYITILRCIWITKGLILL